MRSERLCLSLTQNHTAISRQFGFIFVVWRLRQVAQVGSDSHSSSVPGAEPGWWAWDKRGTLLSQLLTPYDCSEGDPSKNSVPRKPVQGQDLDCPTVLQGLEARPMGMSATSLYGKGTGLMKTSVTGPFSGARGPSDSGQRDGDTGFATSQICTPISL